MFFGFFGSAKKTKLDELKECWQGINSNVSRKEKKESLNKYLKQFHQILKDTKSKPDDNTQEIYDHIINHSLLSKLVDFCTDYLDQQLILLDDVSIIIREAKNVSKLVTNNQKFIKSLNHLILFLENKMKGEKHKFLFKNSFAFFLNEVTRLVLNYPELIHEFKHGNDFIIFSNLLYLLQMDSIISNYEVRKFIRRSLIVSLSFDEIASSSYLETINLCEILVNKLCNYYQMLPSYFNIVDYKKSIEVAHNMNQTFHVLTDFYFEFKDYVIFFNKMCNTIRSHVLKQRLKHYLFNKFCIGNVQKKILSYDSKVVRTNFQYLITMLHDSQNSDIIDLLINFLFGFNDQKNVRKYNEEYNDSLLHDYVGNSPFDGNAKNTMIYHHQFDFDISNNYDYVNHIVSKISSRILNNLNNPKESLNIISLELFELLFEKRPYLMIHKFIKPYVDFCLMQSNDSMKYLCGKKAYPSIRPLLKIIGLYEKYDRTNIKSSIEYNMYKNYSYYMNYDIDFYYYYIDAKHAMDDLEDKSVNENENSKDIDDGKLLEGCLNFDVESISVQPQDNDQEIERQSSMNDDRSEQFNNDGEEIKLDLNLFNIKDEVKEQQKNMNYLLMKYIHLKLCNFLNNTMHENIFLTNFLLTMVSVPCLQFDTDLVECNALLLEDDSDSKYSLVKVARYIAQEIIKRIKDNEHFDIFFKRRIKEIQIEEKNMNPNKTKTNNMPPIDTRSKTYRGAVNMLPSASITFELKIEKAYQSSKMDLMNYIVFFEFLKEFVTTYSHKFRFENLVEDIYGVYSNLLDEFYYNENNMKTLNH